MWTPRRVLLLLAGAGAFVFSYCIYAFFLGRIDGLPQLPEEFWPDLTQRHDMPVPVPQVRWADVKLTQAFGPQSDALRRAIKVEAQSGTLFLATDEFQIQPDGRVRLTPLRVAIFGKSVAENGTPEINTISCKCAFLSFDRPVTNAFDIGNHKITGAELDQEVIITNNRRTPLRDDDVFLTTPGPVYYDEAKNSIWTDAVVSIVDPQTKPEPTTIKATGMDVYLLRKAKPGQAPSRKTRTDAVSGVERVVLRSGVSMWLWEAGNSSFLGPARPEKPVEKTAAVPPTTTPARPALPAKIVITTDGPFTYDMVKDHAQFDISRRASISPQRVTVTRNAAPAEHEHLNTKLDVLDCDHLELQFVHQPKNAAPANAARDEGTGLTIHSAHAWAEHGNDVVLFSDAELLQAYCAELFYDAASRTTTLKSESEIVAIKDGNELRARELRLANKETYRETTALGPGHIDLLDKKIGKRTMHARWQESLVSTKDGAFDCLRLRGDAAFIEDDGEPPVDGQTPRAPKQMLSGQELKVWLVPAKQPSSSSDDPQSRVHVDRLEAQGNVLANSAELHIKAPTDNLKVVFHDPPATAHLAAPAVKPVPATPVARSTATGSPSPSRPASTVTAAPKPGAGGQSAAGTAAKPKKPMDLSARFIKVEVIRWPDHNEVRDLRCEGDVMVHQDPATPEERGVDIRGNLLLLVRVGPDAYDLDVRGDLARVQLDKITIHGPQVEINQQTNVAEVRGIGILQMPASRDFNGNALNKPTDLTIRWQKHMLFEGAARRALFEGHIQANQGTGGLLCDVLQVSLDRPVSFKQGSTGGGQSAHVDHLVCDKDVYLEDNPQEDGRVVGYQRLATPLVEMDNADGTVAAGGPGILHIVKQGGGEDDPLAPPSTGRDKPRSTPAHTPKGGKAVKNDAAEDKFTLTQVKYVDRLSGDNRKRLAIFYGDVEVIHGPVDRKALLNHALLNVDRDQLPPGFMYLRADKMTVYNGNATGAASHQSQSMRAEGRVSVRAREFWGFAAIATYDEDKDAIVLDGNGGQAVLYRVRAKGEKPDTITGKKIKYWRQTNNYQVEEAGESTIGQ